MKRFLFFILLINVQQGIGQSYVLIPDANFRAYLHSVIPNAMQGNLLNINSSLVTTLTNSINISSKGIYDLNGIQYFSSLTYLNCNNNNIYNIPTLPNSLQYLYCGYNNLANIPTLPNSLKTLYCSGNYSLTNLPTLPNLIETLICDHIYKLTSLPELPNTIKTLYCQYNSLVSLPALPISLISLDCGTNSLTSLPTLPNSLWYLQCDINSLTSLPSLPESLGRLFCGQNQIKCLPKLPMGLGGYELGPNPFTCLPNYLPNMPLGLLGMPLCVAGNANACSVVNVKEEYNNSNSLNVFPNPSNGQFTVEIIGTEKQTIQLFDINGKLLFSQIIKDKTNIDLTSLYSGVYNLTIKAGNSVANKKIVIVH